MDNGLFDCGVLPLIFFVEGGDGAKAHKLTELVELIERHARMLDLPAARQ
jgi:hypothetical protein